MNSERQNQIAKWLNSHGIRAVPMIHSLAVDRTSMCQSKFAVRGGFPEETVYPHVLSAINEQFPASSPHDRLSWWGKTDEFLFLDTLDRN